MAGAPLGNSLAKGFNNASLSVTPTIPAGLSIVIYCYGADAGTISLTVNGVSIGANIDTLTDINEGNTNQIWVSNVMQNAPGGVTTILASFSAGVATGVSGLMVSWWSGLKTSGGASAHSAQAQGALNGTVANSISSGAASAPNQPALVIVLTGCLNSADGTGGGTISKTVGTGFTSVVTYADDFGCILEYKRITSTGSQTGTFQASGTGSNSMTTDTLMLVLDELPVGPTITLQPATTYYASGGGSASLVVAATAGTGGLTYQWYRNGVLIAGATAATYTNSFTYADEGASYYCIVTDGAAPLQSDTARVYMRGGFDVYLFAGQSPSTSVRLRDPTSASPSVAAAGESDGTSTVAGAVTATGSAAGTSAGTSTPSLAATGTASEAGESDGAATAAATLSPIAAGAGLATGAATSSGDATGTGAPAGTAAGVAADTIAATGAGVAAGESDGTAAATEAATGDIQAAGASAGTAAATLTADEVALAAGDADGTATTAGAATGTGAPAGTAAGTATETIAATGDATAAGETDGTAAASATLTAAEAAAGESDGAATAAGAATGAAPAAGDADGAATDAGAATGLAFAAGAADGGSSATADTAQAAAAAGHAPGTGGAAGAATGTMQAAGHAAATSTATLTVTQPVPLSAFRPPPSRLAVGTEAMKRLPPKTSTGSALVTARAYFPGARLSTSKGMTNVIEASVFRNGRWQSLQFARVGNTWRRTAVIPPGTNSKG